MQNYPAVFIRGLHGFPWYRAGFRPDHRRRGIALRTAAAGYQAEPVGDELLPPQDDQAKDVAMMEMVIPVSSAMSWARVIE